MQLEKRSQPDDIIQSKYGEFMKTEARLYDMPGGVFGFVNHRKWYLIVSDTNKYFCYLQSEDDIDAALILIHKDLCYPDYPLEFREENLGLLMLDESQSLQDCGVFFVANIPSDASQITINLQGPVVFNPKSNRAIQAISVHEDMKLKNSLMAMIKDKFSEK